MIAEDSGFPERKLQQKLSTFDLTMIVMGSIIGSGIFLTPSAIGAALPSAALILFVWGLGGVLALSGALTYAELGALLPRAGGQYVFLREAYGGLVGFLYGWVLFLVINTGGLAALSIAFATYLGYFISLSELGIKLVAISGILFLAVVNYFGVKPGGIFSDVFTVLKLAGILGLIVFGLFLVRGEEIRLTPVIPEGDFSLSSAITLAMIGVLWSYGGWQHVTYTAGEAKTPRKSLPIALILGVFGVVLIYLLTNLAYLNLLPISDIASSERVAADAMERHFGPAGAALISGAIFISTFGTAGVYTLSAPRVYFAMANDGVFFRRVAEVHPRYRVPAISILAQTFWAIVLVSSGTFLELITYVTFTDWIFFALTGMSVFIFRKKLPTAERPYKTWGYPLTPIFFVAVSVWFVLTTLFEAPVQSAAGLGFLFLGIPAYFIWKKYSSKKTAS